MFSSKFSSNSQKQSITDHFKQTLPFKSISKPQKPDLKSKIHPKNKPKNNHQGQQSLSKFFSLKPTAAVPISDGKIPGHSLLISCWNINGLRATLSKAYLQDYMKERMPDILCLNETKIDKESLDRESSTLTKWIPSGYTHYFNCSKLKRGYSGTAIITKYKPINVKYGIGIEKHDMEGRVVTAEFERFYLVCVYVPNSGQHGDRLEYRLKEWNPAFGEYLKRLTLSLHCVPFLRSTSVEIILLVHQTTKFNENLDICVERIKKDFRSKHCRTNELKEKKDVILAGDLNVAYGFIDIHETKGPGKFEAGFSSEERESFKRFLEEGWTDTFRELYPKKVQYSYWPNWDGYRSGNKGWRVDYFVVNQEAMKAVKDSMINCEIMGSDHCPVELFYDPNFGITGEEAAENIQEETIAISTVD